MQKGKLGKGAMIALAAGVIALVAGACASEPEAPSGPPAASNLIVDANTVTGHAEEVSCVLANQFKPGGHVVWRMKVHDPVTGQPMDDEALESVEISLPDGQTFEAEYGGHPASNPSDFFWATSWEIPEDYPTGSLPYQVTATAVDGRTGTFTEYNVAPSLLTIIEQ
jgi:hypothetical protein